MIDLSGHSCFEFLSEMLRDLNISLILMSGKEILIFQECETFINTKL